MTLMNSKAAFALMAAVLSVLLVSCQTSGVPDREKSAEAAALEGTTSVAKQAILGLENCIAAGWSSMLGSGCSDSVDSILRAYNDVPLHFQPWIPVALSDYYGPLPADAERVQNGRFKVIKSIAECSELIKRQQKIGFATYGFFLSFERMGDGYHPVVGIRLVQLAVDQSIEEPYEEEAYVMYREFGGNDVVSVNVVFYPSRDGKVSAALKSIEVR